MRDLKEDELINGIKLGNTVIIKDFYLKNLPIITDFILKNSGSKADAEDVFHDAFVITYQKLRSENLHLDCTLSTYLYSVSRNLWMNVLRKRKKVLLRNEIINISRSTDRSIVEMINHKDRQLLYHKYFLRLGKTCQQILVHFFDGKSMADISELMGYSEGYARKKKFECKKRLLEMIEEDTLYKELNFFDQKDNVPFNKTKKLGDGT